MPTEADTCRKLVVLKLQAAGWDNEPHSISQHGNVEEIIGIFGGLDQLRNAVSGLQAIIYTT